MVNLGIGQLLPTSSSWLRIFRIISNPCIRRFVFDTKQLSKITPISPVIGLTILALSAGAIREYGPRGIISRHSVQIVLAVTPFCIGSRHFNINCNSPTCIGRFLTVISEYLLIAFYV